MYFEIENTPEHIRRSRRHESTQKKSPKEERPRLILAPFSRRPQVVFENVPVGTKSEKTLEVFNPSKQVQQITLGQSLPAGLIIHLPEECLVLEPETCYCLTLSWTPMQPTALRNTITFTNENRGRYDVIVVLRTGMNVKGKGKPKGLKISPGKIKKKSYKKSPVAIYKKKAEVIYNATMVQKTIKFCQTTRQDLQPSNKENILTANDYSLNSQLDKCPFDSPNSINFNFDTSEIFSNLRQLKNENLQQTYDKSYSDITQNINNVLKPSNKQTCNVSGSELFDNLTFTPLKTNQGKSDKLDKGPKIILSMNSDSDFDDSLNMKNSNKENETHSIISITSTQPPNKCLTINHQAQLERQFTEVGPIMQSKKIPNTSSPKEFNSPNFSINTEFSRISDLSFLPQRYSTEKKVLPRCNNDTHDIIEDPNLKLSSDTYTKDSPNTPVDFQMYTLESYPPYYFTRDQQPKMCRQALFKEYYQQRECRGWNQVETLESNDWQREIKSDVKSPSRPNSPTPLQSIPEESTQFSDTHVFDKNDKTSSCTINRTFDRGYFEKPSISGNRESWSKKSVRAEPELWKMPASFAKKSIKPKHSLKGKESLGGKLSNNTFEINKSINQNISITSQVGNVYSQSFTVDPFLSTTYFYDEEAVFKFEKEFKRWLNCILTPPADLESNIEQKIDVGKAWLENRNKEVPLAPTKEQVSSAYHNSRRLESLRRAARVLLKTPEIALVFQKLVAQIEKKLIAIRTDRNLHLDVGLQKIIMEILLSYNPLWLRIGLEAIYGITLPLKSNSDIEGLTTFIIQRMFKNPFLKNKHSKSNAPNMLLPAYMEAIKKFTLKKFFMLVFFLDQAKQRKLISHDPCLFCRNAVCKESREVIIRFTRELIAGIGDITKHLRPLGYIVSHKQSYLDEYKYAVNNIAIDLRDGVRLSKVMEIILMKNGLLHQLRTPAISRLQKIHNVQVAFNALKEANFVIVGNITAQDIADGHREKTLSLLWQLIHVFRAPLFEKAASVIQIWWKKKYQVIVEKRQEEEKLRERLNNAASVIQRWWRRIQHDRLVEWQMQQVTRSTIIIQKYFRRWLHRKEYINMKRSALKIEDWYRSMKMVREAKEYLNYLKIKKERLRQKSATIIQSHVRRWLCSKQYRLTVNKVVLIQSLVRRVLVRKPYLLLKKYTIYIQQKYRSKQLMKIEMKTFAEKKKSALIIQKYYRMWIQQRKYKIMRQAAIIIKKEKEARKSRAAIKIQRWYRSFKIRNEIRRQFLEIKTSAIKIQSVFRMYSSRKKLLALKQATVTIQRFYRLYKLTTLTRHQYLHTRNCIVKIQATVRCHISRERFLRLRKAALTIQAAYRLKKQRDLYKARREAAAICIQKNMRRFLMQSRYRQKSATIIQSHVRRWLCSKQYRLTVNKVVFIQSLVRRFLVRKAYLLLKKYTIYIQHKYRSKQLMKIEMKTFAEKKKSVLIIQKYYRMWIQQRKYKIIRQAAIIIKKEKEARKFRAATKIQRWYRSIKIRNEIRRQFLEIKTSAIKIQSVFRMYSLRKKLLALKQATVTIQRFYRLYKLTILTRHQYLHTRNCIVKIQAIVRCHISRERFLRLRKATLTIQAAYRFKKQRDLYKARREAAAICIQKNMRRFLVQSRYRLYRNRIIFIQKLWKGKLVTRLMRCEFVQKRNIIIRLQSIMRGYLIRKQIILKKDNLLKIKEEKRRHWAASKIQALFRGHKARMSVKGDMRVAMLRQRWREGALKSTQETLKERNEEAMEVLRNMADIYTVIRAFRSLELLTEVFPMMYHDLASSIARRVYVYMSVTNRSISSIEVLKSSASVLVNLTRYKVTGPKIYARDLIPPILKFMWRFSNSETDLFCILSTYLWLFSKYDDARKDLTEFLHMPENHKMMTTIKENVSRMKRMKCNAMKSKYYTPQTSKFVVHTGNRSALNYSICSTSSNSGITLPALEPDYGILRADRPRYFEDAQQAISCLFYTYNL